MLRFAERKFLGVLFVALKARLRHDDPPRRKRELKGYSGFRFGRIEPAAPEDRMAQAPRVGIPGVRDPGAHTRFDIAKFGSTRSPLVAKSAQAIAEPAHGVLGQAAMAIRVQLEAEELGRSSAGQDHGLARMQPEPAANEKIFDPRAPIGEPKRGRRHSMRAFHDPLRS